MSAGSGNGDRIRRWRLVLGSGNAEGTGVALRGTDAEMDAALSALYDQPIAPPGRPPRKGDRRGGLGASAPRIARWLGDIRRLFPVPVVQVLQRDAFDRLGIERLLLEPEMLEAVRPDVHLVTTLMGLRSVMPNKSKALARTVVRQVVENLLRHLEQPARQAMTGSLDRAARTGRPRPRDIDWNRTILRNLAHYQPDYGTIIPARWVGFGRRRPAMRDLIVCVDQSASMGASLLYASLYACVLASIPAVRTSLVAFDTAVVDLTDQIHDDPVDLLFGLQLGGGTDIVQALSYCESLVRRPEDTILVLVSDLFEGGSRRKAVARAARLARSGVQIIALLALDDDGEPAHDREFASSLAHLGIPCFACTPDQFPRMMAEAIERRDVGDWAAREGIVTARSGDEPDARR